MTHWYIKTAHCWYMSTAHAAGTCSRQDVCKSYVTHMNESCHTHERGMSHAGMRHVAHMNESCHTYERVMSHVWMSHAAHMHESCHAYEWVTYEWVMPQLQMSHVTRMNESRRTRSASYGIVFRKRALWWVCLLRKETLISYAILCLFATLYMSSHVTHTN